MAKVTATITDKQSGITASPIPRPILNPLPISASTSKKRYLLLDQNDKTVATLINLSLAEQWVNERRKGAVKWIENNY